MRSRSAVALTRALSDPHFSRRAHELIPGGAHTYSRGDDQFPLNAPRALVRGKGARVWDLNGREFVDWGMGINNVLIGHAEPAIDDAAIAALRDGQSFSRPSPLELEAAEAVLGLYDDMDMVKFAKSGSDANTAAIRLARAITGRELVAFDGSAPFLSIHDWFIGTTAMRAGVPEAVRRLSIPFTYNDTESVRRIFAERPGQVAALIMEVCREVRPLPGFLETVRSLCDDNGTLLIFDEIVTGFRYDIRGAHRIFGIRPDLMTLGKAMANGYSLSAVLGRREYMERGGLRHDGERVFFLSTTNGPERSALAACIATVGFYREHDVVARLHQNGVRIQETVAAAARSHGIAEHVTAVSDFSNRPVLQLLDGHGKPSLEFRTLFAQELIRGGVFMPWICPSYRHADDEHERTAVALDAACTVYARALEAGSTIRFLEGPAVKPVFRSRN